MEENNTEEIVIFDEITAKECGNTPSTPGVTVKKKKNSTSSSKNRQEIEERKKQREEKKAEKLRKETEARQKREEQEKRWEETRKMREQIAAQRAEAKLKREEEKLQREKELLDRELAKQKADEEKKCKDEKSKQRFSNYFVRKTTGESETFPKQRLSLTNDGYFKPFVPREGMKLAPTLRTDAFTEPQKSAFCALVNSEQDIPKKHLYLCELRSGNRRPRRTGPTLYEQPEIILLTDDSASKEAEPTLEKREKKKLLQFCENSRPAKYGVWTKRSKTVSGRSPFVQDNNVLDYDEDSDVEWEEPEGDECLSDEEDDDPNDESDDDSESQPFFVDHGYLSPSEDVDEQDIDAEARRERSKARMLTFHAEMEARKMKNFKLIAVGPWWPDVGGCPTISDDNLLRKLREFRTFSTVPIPIPTSFTPDSLKKMPCASPATGEKRASIKRKRVEDKEYQTDKKRSQ